MGFLLVTCIVLAVAIVINSTSVYIQKHHKFYSRYKNGWLWHCLIILPAWIAFVVLAANLQSHYVLNFYRLVPVGYVLMVVSATIFGLATHQVGISALANGNFFGKGKISYDGVFSYMNNPIYNSYILLFISISLILGNATYLILAVESYVGLNLIESRVERIKSKGV